MKTEIKEQKEGLRLDYFLSLGLKLVEGDKYHFGTMPVVSLSKGSAITMNSPDINNKKRLVTSFSPRKNTGEQPCGDDVPVVVEYEDRECADDESGLAHLYEFDLNMGCIKTWKPDLEALIKMQAEHDKKVDRKEKKKTVVDAVNYFNGELDDGLGFMYISIGITGHWIRSSELYDNYELVCTFDEFNQCVKEMAKDPRGNGEKWDYELYKRDYAMDEPEWKNGDECIHDCILGVSIIISEGLFFKPNGMNKIFNVSPEDLKKPIDEREQKAKALAEICWTAFDCNSNWEKLDSHTKESYCKMIDAGVELPSNEQ